MDSLDKLYFTKEDSYFESIRKEIEPLLPLRIERVLEIGCGSGATLQWLKREKGCSWIAGVELSDAAAKKAKADLDYFLAGNIEKIELSIENESLDVVLCLDVLEHLVDPWLVVKRLTQFLKPNGVLIVSLPNIMHRSAMMPLLLNDRWDYTPSGILDKTHLRFFTKNTAIELLEQAELNVDLVLPVLQISKRSKTWFFDMLTFHVFRRFFTTQYLVRGVNDPSKVVKYLSGN
ncbi:UbiG 2-polyprenyl-3-methyl-5-hydroxy-6-metoxy-1,4-benzoquinol methylase [Methylophilaceae bacterium]